MPDNHKSQQEPGRFNTPETLKVPKKIKKILKILTFFLTDTQFMQLTESAEEIPIWTEKTRTISSSMFRSLFLNIIFVWPFLLSCSFTDCKRFRISKVALNEKL